MAKKKISYDLFGKLQKTTIEREVEDVYNEGISLYFIDSRIEHPFECDGYVSEGFLIRLLIEYKFDETFSNSVARAKVLVQVLFYMKRFENNGLPLPNVVMVGDRNECFVIHSNDIIPYLDEEIDWKIAPSHAAEVFPLLVAKIAKDESINPFIFKIEKGFNLKLIIDRIYDLSYNVKRYVHVTEHNIAEIFDYFVNNVLIDPIKLDPHVIVEIFLGILLEPLEYYQHPNQRNLLVAGKNRYPVHGDAFQSFFDYYKRSYSPQEKMKFTEIADRLIEDVARRFSGEFFTPTPFVDYAHRMFEKAIGEEWKNEFVVWDASCGTKNLTRDYRFTNLFCSTLRSEDLQLSQRYNQEAESFLFDFLNDSDDHLPESLLSFLRENHPIVFFQNPPYATAGNNKSTDSESKKDVAKTVINKLLLTEGVGKASQNLYAQFIYRMILIKRKFKLTNCYIGLFSPTLFLSGPAWKEFRRVFFNEFEFIDGVQFKASNFADVSDSWGISFTLWKSGRTLSDHFSLGLLDRTDEGVRLTGNKILYNLDNCNSASDWVQANRLVVDRVRMITAKSSLNISNKVKTVGKCLGFFINDCNNVDANTKGVYLMSMPVSRHIRTVEIVEENLLRCCSLFASRKLIEKNWVNSKDEYRKPNEDNVRFQEFSYDSLIFSLFSKSSNQSSLRSVSYGNERWDIHNEFFFMSQNDLMLLANDFNNMDCFQDARTDTERFIYLFLKDKVLSDEAMAVLNKARSLVTESFQFREVFNLEHPSYQINNWDCGWYQIRALLKQYDNKGLKEFEKLFKTLSDKMKPMIYELGFLE